MDVFNHSQKKKKPKRKIEMMLYKRDTEVVLPQENETTVINPLVRIL